MARPVKCDFSPVNMLADYHAGSMRSVAPWPHRRGHRPCGLVRTVLAVTGGLLALAGTPTAAQDDGSRPLPDPETFLEQVRAHERTDRLLLSQYTYMQERTEMPRGRPEKATTKLFQIFPAVDPDQTYIRLLAVDGEPLEPDEVEKQDRKRRKQLVKRAERLAREGVSEWEKRRQEDTEERRSEGDLVEEILTIFDFRMVRREIIDGYTTIIVSFTPRRDAKPRSREGKIFKKARGHLWISEEDYRVVRVEAELIADATIGFGLIGRMHKGSTFSLRFRKVNDEIWVPAGTHLTVSGRILLFRTFSLDTLIDFPDYQKLAGPTTSNTTLPR